VCEGAFVPSITIVAIVILAGVFGFGRPMVEFCFGCWWEGGGSLGWVGGTDIGVARWRGGRLRRGLPKGVSSSSWEELWGPRSLASCLLRREERDSNSFA